MFQFISILDIFQINDYEKILSNMKKNNNYYKNEFES